MKEPPKHITEQFCANCKYYFYRDFEATVKTCWNKEQSHDYVSETDYCFRHEIDPNKKLQKKGNI